MSADTLLWLILAGSLFAALIGVAIKAPADRVAIKRLGVGSLVFVGLLGIAVNVLWVLYAVAVGDWRFAAIAVGGFLIHMAGSMGGGRS